jgi:hypothetical protein
MGFTIFRALLLVLISVASIREGGGDLPHAVGCPPMTGVGIYCRGLGGGNPRLSACGFGSARSYARQQERRPALFAGLPPCAGRCEDGAAERNG